MKPTRRSAMTVFAFLAFTPVSYGWGNEGHQTVARIAARNLTQTGRDRIAAILRAAKDDDLELIPIIGKSGTPSEADMEGALVEMATWPDHMPGGKGSTAPWHFIDVGLFEGPGHLAQRCGPGCVNQKIRELITSVKTGRRFGKFSQDRQLRFLVHFLGDIHQPLHAATDADAGGNCIPTKPFNGSDELHAVWDTGLVRAANVRPFSGLDALIGAFSSRADEFRAKTDPDEIANESFLIARDKVYAKATPSIPTIDHFVNVIPSKCKQQAPHEITILEIDAAAAYDNPATLDVVREQLFKAGVRLAEILNNQIGVPR